MNRRALILAGGGIRVAWQAGAVRALDEAGLTFDHGDGASGGLFTLGMLLSGVAPADLGERWRTLRMQAFMRPLPLRTYLRSPTNWPAIGSADGIREDVLPHLGIDFETIRNSTTAMTGSFNVADFGTKQCVAIPHSEIDVDRFLAGVSLPFVMPALETAGTTWTDAVWIQDANLLEAVRRGCDELWVLWCIANTRRWGTGGLEQYVHMIELSANSALIGELRHIADINARRARGEEVLGGVDPIVVHVVIPEVPLPLDPDLVMGRIDAETLVAMGHRDAAVYLAKRRPNGTPLDVRATAMREPGLGARVTLRAGGAVDGPRGPEGAARLFVVVEARDLQRLVVNERPTAPVVGAMTVPNHGYLPFRSGRLRLPGREPGRLEADVSVGGAVRRLTVVADGVRRQRFAPQWLRWTLEGPDGEADTTGTVRVGMPELRRSLVSFEPSAAHNLKDRVRALRLAWRLVRRGTAPPADSPA